MAVGLLGGGLALMAPGSAPVGPAGGYGLGASSPVAQWSATSSTGPGGIGSGGFSNSNAGDLSLLPTSAEPESIVGPGLLNSITVADSMASASLSADPSPLVSHASSISQASITEVPEPGSVLLVLPAITFTAGLSRCHRGRSRATTVPPLDLNSDPRISAAFPAFRPKAVEIDEIATAV
jgi:hypothetical protein